MEPAVAFEEEKEELDGEDGKAEEPIDPVKLAAEMVQVEAMRDLARGIGVNGKGEKLVFNLPAVLDEIAGKGGQRKAVIFTESVRTQRYLHQLLTDNGYAGRIVLMNGSNNDPESRALYEAWKAKHAGSDRISGSKSADMKAAIVEAFRGDEKTVLIATESGAEGINLQFCSLLINYDLPWNPQRVEQRIGRCHRYGQLVDVTVVNMLNLKNRAEARIHQLLQEIMPIPDAEREEVLVVAQTDAGEPVPPAVGDKMMMAPAISVGMVDTAPPNDRLTAMQDAEFGAFSDRIAQESYAWLVEKETQLGQYARDREIEIEAQVGTLDAEIKDLERAKRAPGLGMEDKLARMREIRKKETARDELKMTQFEAKRKVNAEINQTLDDFAALLDQKPRVEELFTLRWTVA